VGARWASPESVDTPEEPMRVTKQYDEDFKADALQLLERGGRTISQVARDLGVSHWTLRGWCRRASMSKRRKKGALAALNPAASESAEQKLKRLERENERLKKENESLRTDREILKKAAAFFAKESE
jgi:transposase